jgi:ankyrin repeat protein
MTGVQRSLVELSKYDKASSQDPSVQASQYRQGMQSRHRLRLNPARDDGDIRASPNGNVAETLASDSGLRETVVTPGKLLDIDHTLTEIAAGYDLHHIPQIYVKHPAYKHLQDDGIRLLKILPKGKGSIISCHIQEFLLYDAPDYVALSYAWGSKQGEHHIMVNDHPLMVPKNLWRFLNHARNLGGDLSMWIWMDMLSINQTDLSERGHQVDMMFQIFQAAKHVIVWLGPAYRDSDTALAYLASPSCDQQFVKQARRIRTSPARPAVEDLCWRPYWRRLWVFQELRAAQDIRLMCGDKIVDWHRFQTFMQLTDATRGLSRRLDDDIEIITSSPAMRMTRLTLESVDVCLWSLIQETSHLRCADTRDKVYALLGVATQGNVNIQPDYRVPVPTLLNRILHEIWDMEPPKSLPSAVDQCRCVEEAMGVQCGTVFLMQDQLGTYDPPSTKEMQACKLGPNFGDITLWWTVFYGHSSVQLLLRRAWDITYFESDVDIRYAGNKLLQATVSLFDFLHNDMDVSVSFLRPPPLKPEYHAHARGEHNNASMDWVALYFTVAISRDCDSVERLLNGIARSCGLKYLRADVAGLAPEIAHMLSSRIAELEESILYPFETLFRRIDTFVSDGFQFAKLLLTSIRGSQAFVQLLDFYLKSTLQRSQKTTLVNQALSDALEKRYQGHVVKLLTTGLCDPNYLVGGRYMLSTALSNRNRTAFTRLLRISSRNVNISDPSDHMTPLMHAASLGLPVELQALLRTGECEVNGVNRSNGMTPLHYAACNRDTSVVRALLGAEGCDINASDSRGRTALMFAARSGYTNVVRMLSQSPVCNVNLTDTCGKTALMVAAAEGHVDIMLTLLQNEDCDVKMVDLHGWTALMHAVCREENSSIACSRTGDCNIQRPLELVRASNCNIAPSHFRAAACLLDRGRDGINARDNTGQTPLILAVRNATTASQIRLPNYWGSPVVRLLLGVEGCDVDSRSYGGDTALNIAVERGNIEFTHMLISYGQASVSTLSRAGEPLLSVARKSEDAVLKSMLTLKYQRSDSRIVDK